VSAHKRREPLSDLQFAPDVPPELRDRSLAHRAFEEALRFIRKGFARVLEFAPTKLNFSWITDSLAVGGAVRTADIPRMRKMGVGAVIDCRAEAQDDVATLRKNGIEFLWLPAPDTHEIKQEDLDVGVRWAAEQLDEGRKVYVHCLHGVGRGPLMGACILVNQGMSATDALRLVKARRWQASPNEEQMEALVTYARRHHAAGTPE
jgi:protein tyrosine phosphatase (PTP) superfamily phosphohydrolase (DUF442 family)